VTAPKHQFLSAVFSEARTFSHWQPRPVPKELVEAAFALACLGPTSGNCQPMRLVLVHSPAAKERLLPCVSSGNHEKVRTAPITAIAAYDRGFFELLPRLYPHTDARSWFTSNPALVEETGLRNSCCKAPISFWPYAPRDWIAARCPVSMRRRSMPRFSRTAGAAPISCSTSAMATANGCGRGCRASASTKPRAGSSVTAS